MNVLEEIHNSGISISVVGESISVTPSSRLTDSQRQYLKTNKPEIIAELKARQILKKLVTCWTPNGNPMQVEADSDNHAEWLQRVNTQTTAKKFRR
jgi:carbamoylphosphate synthase large subunit